MAVAALIDGATFQGDFERPRFSTASSPTDDPEKLKKHAIVRFAKEAAGRPEENTDHAHYSHAQTGGGWALEID